MKPDMERVVKGGDFLRKCWVWDDLILWSPVDVGKRKDFGWVNRETKVG